MMQSRGPGAGRPGGQARARAWVPRPGACRLCPRRLRLQPSQEAVCPPRQGPGRFPKESPAQVTQGQRPVLRPPPFTLQIHFQEDLCQRRQAGGRGLLSSTWHLGRHSPEDWPVMEMEEISRIDIVEISSFIFEEFLCTVSSTEASSKC